MASIIKLTSRGGDVLYLNPNYVTRIQPREVGAMLSLAFGPTQEELAVRETADEVAALINRGR